MHEFLLIFCCECLFIDIYITCVSATHNVAFKGHYIAMVSTTVETTDPEKELQVGIDLLGPIMETYVYIVELVWILLV